MRRAFDVRGQTALARADRFNPSNVDQRCLSLELPVWLLSTDILCAFSAVSVSLAHRRTSSDLSSSRPPQGTLC